MAEMIISHVGDVKIPNIVIPLSSQQENPESVSEVNLPDFTRVSDIPHASDVIPPEIANFSDDQLLDVNGGTKGSHLAE